MRKRSYIIGGVLAAGLLTSAIAAYATIERAFVAIQKARTLPFPYPVVWQRQGEHPATVLIGDSRFALWPKGLLQDISADPVLNFAVGGSTTHMWRSEIDDLPLKKGDTVLVQMGINDIHYLNQHDPHAAYIYDQLTSNLRFTLKAIKKRGAQPVLTTIICPGEPGFIRRQVTPPSLPESVKRLNTLLRDIAQQEGGRYLDLNAILCHKDRLVGEYQDEDFFLHLSAPGYHTLTTHLQQALQSHR